MFRSRFVKRLTALFVVGFVCLNASGVVCVAYCQTFDLSAKTEHCPLQKLSEHCNKAKNKTGDSKAVSSPENERDCCPFTVSVVAAPVESSKAFIDTAATAPTKDPLLSPVFVAGRRETFIGIAYRGPPPDRRIERLKHCILRI